MNGKTKTTTTLNVGADWVREAVREKLEREGRYRPLDVEFDLVTRTTGYGMGERDEQVFEGATIQVEPR
jgi:hypothetical protein